MAFYMSGLPNIAAATSEILPSISNILNAPWRGSSGWLSGSRQVQRTSAAGNTRISTLGSSRYIFTTSSPQVPEFLLNANLPPPLASLPIPPPPTSISHAIANMSRQSLLAANPLKRPQPYNTAANMAVSRRANGSTLARWMTTSRQSTTARTPHKIFTHQPLGIGHSLSVLAAQRRSFGTQGVSQNLLANREASANRNPGSATAQNAFYQVLLKANMPHIVVERYQSNRFATNDATTQAFQRALGMISSAGPAMGVAPMIHPGSVPAANGQLNAAHMQAVSQAVAAQSQGGHVAIPKGQSGSGAKDSPIHVMVDRPFGDTVFRWTKFALWFVLFTYLSFVFITVMIENMSMLKRPGASRNDSEVKAENQTTRFSDVQGCDEAKEEVQDLVDFLKNPDKFNTLGGKLPKGILLVGPPGTGKTLLARAVAGEAGVPFFYMSGSEFDEIYVGVGAKRVRELFTNAKTKSPAIVFIDELDAIGGKRSARDAGWANKQTLNQLLTELDGFDQNSGVIILAATNFPEMLDKALTRPGRFDRQVVVDLPDVRGRLAILKHHAKKIRLSGDVDLQPVAQQTSGLSGAELESIINQAAIRASKAKASIVTSKDVGWARDKVMMGAERKSMVISPKEKEMTAYHEAGHALVNFFSQSTLYKVTVLPRGRSLGHTAFLPEMDKYSWTVKDYLSQIDVAMGGKVAEEVAYGKDMVTSGVSADLESATNLAFAMVSQFGMSDKLGPVEYNRRYEHLSSETRAIIESEVQKVLEASYERARTLLLSKRNELDLLAKALVEYETLDKDEVTKVISGEKLTDRTAIPSGPMLVPKPHNPSPLDPLPLPGGQSEGGSKPSSPPPPTTMRGSTPDND